MKIAIITLHHVRNFGSLLQTYATQTVIQMLGCETVVIDFVPKGLRLFTGIKTIKSSGNVVQDIIRKIGATLFFSISQASMIRFLNKTIVMTKKQYHTYRELVMDAPSADVFVSGSDQIWNTQNANEADDINAYYLQFVSDKRKVAYASSIGKNQFDDAAEVEKVKNYLKSYYAIGVRESQAVALLDSIGISNAVHVLDPTLLLDRNEWKKLIKRKSSKKPFVFVYNLNRNSNIKSYARLLAKEKNLKIVNFSDTMDFIKDANNRLHNTVYDFLYYLYYAEYVVTDSFHGTAFCINFSKQFVTFGAPRFNSRIISLLKKFSLDSRFLSEVQNDCNVILKKIDYEYVNKCLANERAKSIQFLSNALGIK